MNLNVKGILWRSPNPCFYYLYCDGVGGDEMCEVGMRCVRWGWVILFYHQNDYQQNYYHDNHDNRGEEVGIGD